jgi:predicted transporter
MYFSSPTMCPDIDELKKGYDTHGRVIMDRSVPWCASKNAFCVILSRACVRKGHTVLRLVSKSVSVIAYVVFNALFASSTLLQLQPANIVMKLVLFAGIFGRVTAMWIFAVIMRDRPILHRTVKTKKEAVYRDGVKEGKYCV